MPERSEDWLGQAERDLRHAKNSLKVRIMNGVVLLLNRQLKKH